MKLASYFRRWFNTPKHRTIRKVPARKHLNFEILEERLAPAGGLLYEAVTAAPLTLRLSGNTVEVVNSNTSGVLASKALADIDSGVRIDGHGFNVNLTIDDSVPLVTGGVMFVGGSGTSTLIGPDADTTWSLAGAGAGTATSGASVVTFEGVENLRGGSDVDTFNINAGGSVAGTIDGGDGDDTLVADDVVNAWTVTGEDTGALNSQGFIQVENLTGGSDEDSFLVADGGSITGKFDGGAGEDTLIGPDTVNDWSLTGLDAGTLGDAEFVHVENLTGGSADDTFRVVGASASLSGLLDGGVFNVETPSVNSLDYSQRGAAVSVDLALASGPGLAMSFAGINKVVGSNAGGNTLIGPVAILDHTTWNVTGLNSGTVDGTIFAKFESLTGQNASSDAFIFEGDSVGGTITGGTGPLDGFAVDDGMGNLTAFQPADPNADGTALGVTFAGMDPFHPLSGDDAQRVVTGTIFDRDLILEDDPLNSGMIVSFDGLTFSSGPSSFSFDNPTGSLTLDAGTGSDEIDIVSTDIAFAGSLLTFEQGVLTVTGTDLANTLTVEQTGTDAIGVTLSLTLDGAPAQTFRRVTELVVFMEGGEDTVELGTTINVDVSLDGGDDDDTLFGPDEQVDWYLEGLGEGSVGDSNFVGFEFLRGGSAIDSFKFESDGDLAGDIDGGGGADNLIGNDGDNEWEVATLNTGTLNNIPFANIENLIGGSGDDAFVLLDAAGVSGMIDGGIDDDDDGDGEAEPEADSIDYSDYSTEVTVNLGTSMATGMAGFVAIDAFTGSGTGNDEVMGPAEASVLWSVIGDDEVLGVTFSSFENLTGAANNTDAFLITSDGSISGTVDGGTGGIDGLAFIDANDNTKVVNPAGADASGTTLVADFGKAVTYAGIDNVNYYDNSDPLNPTISGTIFNDTIRVYTDPGNALGLKVSFGGTDITLTPAQITALQSLRVDALDGSDTITVESLPTNFIGSLILYGNRLQRNDLLFPDMPEDDPYPDHVTFTGDISVGYLEVFADHIKVNDDVKIEAGDDGIFFRQRMIGVSTVENLLPVFATVRSVSLDVGERAELSGGAVYFVLQADDKSLAEILGASKEISNFIIDPLTGLITDALALPVKVLVKQSTATINLRAGSKITSSGTIGMYATAAADASGTASSSMISVGYAQAMAHAEINIEAGVAISGGEAVVITSTGNATANISASTQRELDSTPNPGGTGGGQGKNQFAVAIGVAYADVFSHVTMADTAVIFAGKTANVTAGGEIESEASGEAGIYGSGAAGLGFGIEISKANIHAKVDGKITANMIPGSVVKLEIDPTVSAGTYTTDDTTSALKNGETVLLKADVNSDLPKGTVLKYIGPDINASTSLAIADQDYADEDLWEVTTPNFGYVDYDGNRIFLGDTSLVTEDTITYTNRRGTSIGNMVDTRSYFVINDGDGYYKFAETETQAIRASLGHLDGNVVDLIPQPGDLATANNERGFDGSDIDADANSIALLWKGEGVFNTFELGQAVVYHEGTTPIPGLVDGGTYYVAASTSQNNLQGNTRFADKQVIGLSESENESRAGVLIDIGSSTGTGYKLAAKHVLDSDFATGLGVVAKLSADNKATASAGVTSEDTSPGYISKFKSAVSSVSIDTLFGKLTKSYADKVKDANKALADSNTAAGKTTGASNSMSVAGALAFTFAEHIVRADVGSTAELKSNEDLEVKALLTQNYTLGAESNAEPQDGSPSADTMASVAINVGIFNNTALATVHSNAQLDGLRATRVISDVSYPFLTRLDQYIPLSWGEFVDGIRNDGLEAVTKYLNTNLGLKDAFFNTWVTSTAKAEKLGIAASVNVVVLTNVSEAVVKSGAKINQDPDWHNNDANPHGNQGPNRADLNAGDGKGEQVVSIEATNYQQTVNMTGNFKLPDLDLDLTDDPNATKAQKRYKLKKSYNLDPAGTGGSSGGAGGSIFITVQDNKTHAIVEDGASVYSGGDGGFNMKAEEALLNVNLAQAWAKGGGFAFGGTFLYVGQTSDTLAQLGNEAVVTGREARLYAGDLTTTVSWAGGIAKGESIGMGVSVAVNNINRTTQALIGDEEVEAGTPLRSDTSIDVTDGVQTLARVSGDVWAFTIAGAVVSEDKQKDPTAEKPTATDPTAITIGSHRANLSKVTDSQEQGSGTGIGIAAAVSVNLINNTSISRIADAGQVHAGYVSVKAENDAGLVAATGGLAVVVGDSGDTSIALAGALSFNFITANTVAEVQDTAVFLIGDAIVENDFDVYALTTSDIFAIAAGGAGSIASGKPADGGGGGGGGSTAVSVAGSVAVNAITGDTTSALRNGSVELETGNARVLAEDNSSIFAIGGGLSLSVATGQQGSSTAVSAGIAIAINLLVTDVEAIIEGNTLSWADGGDGDLLVEALNHRDIGAFTLAGAVSVASGTQGSGIAAAGAASGSVNQIIGDTSAIVRSSTLEVPGPVTVHAEDDSDIISAAGGIAVSVGLSGQGNGGAGAFGAAFAINNIGTGSDDNAIRAEVDDSSITADGEILVEAESSADIFVLAIGAAGSVSNSGSGNAIGISLAGSLAINEIHVNTQALVHNGSSLITEDGSAAGISLLANDASSIIATAGAAALAIAVGQKTAVAAALGFSLTLNEIGNTTRQPSRTRSSIRTTRSLSRPRARRTSFLSPLASASAWRSAATPRRSRSPRPVR